MAVIRPDEMIAQQEVRPARWRLLEEPGEGFEPEPDTVIPLDEWLRLEASGPDPSGVSGVILQPDTDPAPLRERLERIPVVAVHFPKFTDGRGYSHARRVRYLWGYEGPLIAYGDVLRDQLLPMSRCGIDVFYMARGQDLRRSLQAFRTYSRFYQHVGP